eukprot:TRINITY_DN65877_c4_g1_i1.p1 TRINITY_DN65877_c4_g1~~TRINITY_DN65877_c4_g1_i1.p1  ORF type:complete len:180 (-),score=8.90 TRINITY_DN65877_c4_g1_i1:108-647(-)
MFKSGMKAQGKALVKIVTLSLSMLHEQEKFDNILHKLAEVHNERGVKAVEYGIMGESLIWALAKVLGPDVMSPQCTKAWIRVFCRMIRVMIPLAVHYEIENGQAQRLRAEIKQEEEAEAEKKYDEEHNSKEDKSYMSWAIPECNALSEKNKQVASVLGPSSGSSNNNENNGKNENQKTQ